MEKWIYVHKGSTKEVTNNSPCFSFTPTFHIITANVNMLRKLYYYRGLQSNTMIIKLSQRHGYCTLGEAFNRLDFCSAIKDTRRFNYVVRVSPHLSFLAYYCACWCVLISFTEWVKTKRVCRRLRWSYQCSADKVLSVVTILTKEVHVCVCMR